MTGPRHTGRARRIAFATLGDARDTKFWSGTPHYMANALAAAGNDVVHVGPFSASLLPVFMGWRRLCRMFGRGAGSPYHAAPVVAQIAADARRKIAAAEPDVVLAPAGSMFAAATPHGIPLVYTSDATFRVVENYHHNYRALPARARALTDRLEREAIARADLLLYPSKWAADSAIGDYDADPARVHVVPWGANLAQAPEAETVLAPRRPGPFRLLFVGVDWLNKGAATAMATHAALCEQGLDVELTICGCTPPEPVTRPGLTIIPFLDKNDPAERARLEGLFQEADAFVLPTRADCYGIVFCEAAAYATPCIAPATGGVPGAISDGESGILVSANAGAAEYAAAIGGLLADPDRLEALKLSSRRAFETRFNWQSWAERATELIATL